jgi:hypothetical protein
MAVNPAWSLIRLRFWFISGIWGPFPGSLIIGRIHFLSCKTESPFFFFLFWLKLYHLDNTCGPISSGYFGDRVLWTICLGWPWALILQISASQVARIIGMSQWYLAEVPIFADCQLWIVFGSQKPFPCHLALIDNLQPGHLLYSRADWVCLSGFFAVSWRKCSGFKGHRWLDHTHPHNPSILKLLIWDFHDVWEYLHSCT